MVIPAVDKGDSDQVLTLPLTCDADLKDFCQIQQGNLVDEDNKVMTFSTVITNHTYRLFGALYQPAAFDKRRVLQREAALAVQEAVGGSAHVHHNVTLFDGTTPLIEVNAVVHVAEDAPQSTAYLVEAAHSPQAEEVKALTDKLKTFKALAKEDDYFRSVTTIHSVLAGRVWSEETRAAARAAGHFRVEPSGSGGGYRLLRGLHTLVRKIK